MKRALQDQRFWISAGVMKMVSLSGLSDMLIHSAELISVLEIPESLIFIHRKPAFGGNRYLSVNLQFRNYIKNMALNSGVPCGLCALSKWNKRRRRVWLRHLQLTPECLKGRSQIGQDAQDRRACCCILHTVVVASFLHSGLLLVDATVNRRMEWLPAQESHASIPHVSRGQIRTAFAARRRTQDAVTLWFSRSGACETTMPLISTITVI